MPWEPDVLWQDLISVALMGTERQSLQPPTAPPPLGQVLGQLTHLNPEAALLTTAATLSLYTQVGRVVSPITSPAALTSPPPTPCPQETRRPCPPGMTRYLLRMLNGEHALVLPEWLDLVAQAGQRLPDAYLPDLLDLGRQQAKLRPAIANVLGERGRWLAQQNPDWHYAVQIVGVQDWETGSTPARLMFLTDLRSQDSSQALTVLQSTWQKESAADRAKFLSTLSSGLSLADEPFLIAASCDGQRPLGEHRSKNVRRVATDLLASLPESELCRRMTERVRQWVRLNSAGNGLEVQLPEVCDQTMQDDGISLQPQSGKGERSEWLRQIIGATPLGFWQEFHPQGIPALIEMAQRSEWQELFLSGWQQALQRQYNSQNPHHHTWVIELLKTAQADAPDSLQTLLKLLPAADQQTALIRMLDLETEFQEDVHKAVQNDTLNNQPNIQGAAISADAPIWAILSHLAQYQFHPWEKPLSLRVLALIQRYLPTGKAQDVWRMRDVLAQVVLRIAPQVITEAATLRSIAESTPWENTIHHFISTLQFRQEIHALNEGVNKGVNEGVSREP